MVDSVNTQKTTFFKRVGNFFKKNSNTIGRALWTLGDTAMDISMTGVKMSAMEAMLKQGNIWSCGGYGCFGGYGGYTQGYNIPWFAQADPMGLTGWMGTPGYANSYLSQQGIENAYMYGAILRAQGGNQNLSPYAQLNQYQQLQQLQQNIPQKMDYKASKIDADQETETGKNLDTATNELVNEKGEAVDGKAVSLGDYSNAETYKQNLIDKAKSYTAHIAGTYKGEKAEGLVTKEQFINSELDKKEFKNETEKQQFKQYLEIAFSKIDMNGDTKLDYTEYAAMLATFDQEYGSTQQRDHDGKISSTDYAKWNKAMVNTQSYEFDNAIRENRNMLFKKQS